MPTGIGLGLPDSPASLDNVRYYAIESRGEGIAWDRVPANPFAATVNSSGPYDKVDIWNEWVQEDWQAGVGRVDPSEGGFLYAEAETRVPNQVILPPLLQQCDRRVVDGTTDDGRFMPSAIAGSLTVGSGGHERIAIPFTRATTLPTSLTTFHFYGQIENGTAVKVAIYTDSSGTPGTEQTSTTIYGVNPGPHFRWYGSRFNTSLWGTTGDHWLVIEPVSGSDSLKVAYANSGYDTATQAYNSSSWAAISSTYGVFTSTQHQLTVDTGQQRMQVIRFNGETYFAAADFIWKYVSNDDNITSVGDSGTTGNIASLCVFGPTLYIGAYSGNFRTMSTGESFSDGGATGTLFLEYKGLLYRAYQNDLYYSSDGSTWSSAFQAGGDDVSIRGLAGLGDSVYCATDKALVRFAPGDVMEEVSRFGAEDSANGVGMMEHQGALFIPAAGRIYRMDTSGQLQDIWVNREDDLPAGQIGRVGALTRMNNWLVVLTASETGNTFPSVWVWQDEGWHFLTDIIQDGPSATSIVQYSGVYYDRANSRLWINLFLSDTYYLDIDDYAINPYNISTYLYMPYGWLEQDRFYGGQKLLDKSWESVTISAENISSTTPVEVYFQDEDSTEWEYLGKATSDGQELRWNDYATRPAGKWIKLAARLSTTDGDETPRVRAMVVKFLPYPNDRIRDTLVINLSDYAELTGSTKSTYTMAQMRTHFELMVAQVDPFIYVDPLGEAYEVTMRDWNMNASKFDEKGAVTELRVMLVLEQAPESKYL